MSVQEDPSSSKVISPILQVMAAMQVQPPQQPVRREMNGCWTEPKPGSPTAGMRPPPSCSPPPTKRSNTKYGCADLAGIFQCTVSFSSSILSTLVLSVCAGDQCVPDPHAAPRALFGEEGRQAGHQSIVHCEHNPGGLQDTTGKHAGHSWSRIQDRHGNYTQDTLIFRLFFPPLFKSDIKHF